MMSSLNVPEFVL